MGRTWRVGVVGTSPWVETGHLPGLASRADVELAALCGRTRDRLAALAEKLRVPATYTDWREMIARGGLEVLVIATPNRLHAPIALAALEEGLHVICEKPLAMSLSEARSMAALARAKRRCALTFFNYRAIGAAAHMKRLIAEGLLGTPHHVSAAYLKDSYLNLGRPLTWRMRKAEAGSGVLADLGSHVVDLVRYWLGDFVRVCGAWQIAVPERPGGKVDVDDACAFLAELASGVQAMVQVSKLAAGRTNYQRVEICGREGSLVYESDPGHLTSWEGRLLHGRPGRAGLVPLEIPPDTKAGLDTPDEAAGRREAYRRLTDGFFAALAGEKRGVYPDFEDGVAVQAVLEAVASSAEGGRWVKVG
ncbi:MAG TPA: Gfo/Idh/MocA family oxidoreductase [Anaeromyxobacteraceae bacterium]|nr:Gfo/Idh/MocA family oxidoreductase [Anaeromyxobacteraceae bacterium]